MKDFDHERSFDHTEENSDSMQKQPERDASGEEQVQAESYVQPTTKDHDKQPSRFSGKNALVGGVIGGALSALAVALLFLFVIMPSGASGNNQTGNNEVPATSMVENISSENAATSENISETAEAVVGIVNLQQQNVWTDSQESGAGSGIVYKKENGKAYVVTNHHVVEGAEELEVVLNDEERVSAKILGSDALTDLAVLEIDGSHINTVASLGSSTELKVGEPVMAIGNPLGLEFANTVTQGIISGMNRSVSVDTNSDGRADWVTEVLQTDAAINPGNSGGALVDADGKVIGINSMKIASQKVESIGFAIPIDEALPIMEELRTNGEIVRPLIGITTASMNQVPPQVMYELNLPEDVEGGMVIAEVQDGSAADKAGLQRFDVITAINGNKVTSILELRQYLYSEASIGETVEVEFYRDGTKKTLNLELEAREDNQI
ncbi:S1C family serine protease [Virgibacillus xinjiangensis]|uniref:S1C family serine protease n=1 Tax=Virgibacillus xinjiangensis TaxID=393090 RepID=A0ABV7CSU0_9BACI